MNRFRDEKDPGFFLTTHVYLLVACATPIWLAPRDGGFTTLAASGIIAVGIGDAVAALYGSRYGNAFWTLNGFFRIQ